MEFRNIESKTAASHLEDDPEGFEGDFYQTSFSDKKQIKKTKKQQKLEASSGLVDAPETQNPKVFVVSLN